MTEFKKRTIIVKRVYYAGLLLMGCDDIKRKKVLQGDLERAHLLQNKALVITTYIQTRIIGKG